MIVAEAMMMGGMAVLLASDRPRFSVNPLPGEVLRQAFRAPVEQQLPADMRRMADQIARPMYLIAGKDLKR